MDIFIVLVGASNDDHRISDTYLAASSRVQNTVEKER
jgi:hypothetical protein